MTKLGALFLFLFALIKNCIAANDLGGELVQHFLIVEALKVAGTYVVLPALLALIVYFAIKIHVIHDFLSSIKCGINRKIHEWRFKDIYDKESKRDLEKELIRNALTEASSEDDTKKTLAIAQLSQFHQEAAITGLIKLLSKEKHNGFREMIIKALCSMVGE